MSYSKASETGCAHYVEVSVQEARLDKVTISIYPYRAHTAEEPVAGSVTALGADATVLEILIPLYGIRSGGGKGVNYFSIFARSTSKPPTCKPAKRKCKMSRAGHGIIFS